MASTRKKPYPFMVFAEAVPAAVRLADPKTPADEKERLRWKIEDSIEVVKNVADRNTQRHRHDVSHTRRDQVMAGYVPGKRGEPKRLAALHGVSSRTVEKWIAQLRAGAPKGSEAVPNDWRTVYVGEGLRHQNSVAAGRKRQKRRS